MKIQPDQLVNVLCLVVVLALSASALGQDGEEAVTESAAPAAGASERAQKLSYPVANLISIPIQPNFDLGPLDDGFKLQTNIQPVIPFDLSEHWNLITRTIVLPKS